MRSFNNTVLTAKSKHFFNLHYGVIKITVNSWPVEGYEAYLPLAHDLPQLILYGAVNRNWFYTGLAAS
jgi:hypothetical protein